MGIEKPTHPDQKYIEGLLNEDRNLIKEIYKKWGPEARNFVLKNNGTPEDAYDVFQDTIIAVLSKVRKEKFNLYVPLGGYLYWIYRSKWINKINKSGKNQVMIRDLMRYKDNRDFLTQVNGLTQSEVGFKILKDCFAKLAKRCQEILNAQYYEKLKGEEIEKKFEFPSIGSVRKAMYDCREKLKKWILEHPEFKESNLN